VTPNEISPNPPMKLTGGHEVGFANEVPQGRRQLIVSVIGTIRLKITSGTGIHC
jgi:hypothetical protein